MRIVSRHIRKLYCSHRAPLGLLWQWQSLPTDEMSVRRRLLKYALRLGW